VNESEIFLGSDERQHSHSEINAFSLSSVPIFDLALRPAVHKIPDFNDNELWIIHTTLEERYGKKTDVQLADSELRLSPHTDQLTLCPTLHWQDQGVHLVIFKTGEDRYRCMFYYNVREQYGTGIDEFDNLAECVTTLLQVQADHASTYQKDDKML
jgi:hypothetical protein